MRYFIDFFIIILLIVHFLGNKLLDKAGVERVSILCTWSKLTTDFIPKQVK